MSPSSRPCLSLSLILCVSGLSVAASVLAVQLSQTDGPSNHPDKVMPCTRQMFGNKSVAVLACQAQFALQRNWFPDPIQGLFSYQTWNGMDGFWQNGVVLETMANCLHYLNNTRYKSVVMKSDRDLSQLLLAYGPQPSFDDMAWYGLAYCRLYEVTGAEKFLKIARNIFDWVWKEGWDTKTCGGGVWFDNNFSGKETIENVQMIQLGHKLTRLSGVKEYGERAALVWAWVRSTGILDNVTAQVYDGISLSSCKVDTSKTFTYTAGTLVGGLVEMFRGTEDKSHLDLAHNVTLSVIKKMTKEGVLMEPCDTDRSCNLDASIFKGIFVRNLRYLLDVTKERARVKFYRRFLDTNIASLRHNASCQPHHPHHNHTCHIVYLDGAPSYPATGPVFDTVWTGPFKESRPIQQTSALDLLVAGSEPGLRCRGPGCSYDPRAPPPRPLTCADDPCPSGQACCEYSSQFTCCAPGQACQQGFCQ